MHSLHPLWRLCAAAWLCGLSLACVLPAQAATSVDSQKQLQLLGEGRQPARLIGEAAFRVAVFAYDDPDRIGLSEELAALATSEVLIGAPVMSLGVLRFTDPMAGPARPELGYFDRIDLLADSQKVTLSIWGAVRRDGGSMVIDTYLQVPPTTVALGLQVRLMLPRAMGGGELLARIGSDRVLLQRRVMPLGDAELLRNAARRLGELRKLPNDSEPVLRHLPPETVYYLRERRPPWVLVGVSDRGPGGWVRASGHCTGACAPLLEASRFVGGMLGFINQRLAFVAGQTLSPEARVFADQARALSMLDQMGARDGGERAASLLAVWAGDAADPNAGTPPGGAGSANLRLLVQVAGLLKKMRELGGDYDVLRADHGEVQRFTQQAAVALLADPRNAELLHNLMRLWDYLGDSRRARLAQALLKDAQAESRLPLLPAR